MSTPVPLELPPPRAKKATGDRLAEAVGYPPERRRRLSGYLLLAAAFLSAASWLGPWQPPEQMAPMIEVDLGVDAPPGEPPPLGQPDAAPEEKPPEQEPPTPTPPAPEPPTLEPPAPVSPPEPPKPQFIVPEEHAPAPPRPKQAAAPPVPRPRRTAPSTAPQASGPAAAAGGATGNPAGEAGARGGGRADFISTPQPQYDQVARERHYEGRGVFLIRYQNGSITSVSVQQTTGTAYLDARTITWISTRWKVKPDASGSAPVSWTWRLK